MTGERQLAHDPAYFEAMFDGDPDPWGFDTRWYERRKYAMTVAALPLERYRRGYEPGCANGALTDLLAGRCDSLEATDIVDPVVARARERVAVHPHVTVHAAAFPRHWPHGTGDLVVWSELLYYLTDAGLELAADGLERWLEPGGDLIAVHYTGATNYPRSGSSVAGWIDSLDFLTRTTFVVDEQFELGIWRRGEPDRE